MGYKDFHIHTDFSDGDNSAEEMVVAAIKKGLTQIGFSEHSYTFFDESYCLKKEKISEYVNEIKRLKNKYSDKIEVLCGIEQDYYSQEPTNLFDYVIGSVHYLKLKGDVYVPVDENESITLNTVQKYFNGDGYSYAEEYYATLSDVVNKTGADIIGHFDIITKFNNSLHLFDEGNPRYVNAWQKAADLLLSTKAAFEINTSPIYKGIKKEPYPSYRIIEYIKANGGKLIYSSDSHNTDTICFGFK